MTERWDIVVRLTHWLVAGGFLVNRLYLTNPGSLPHRAFGITVVLAVCVRLIWSITFAPQAARLSAIIPDSAKLLQHLHELRTRNFPRHLHHNPLGSIGILLFWLLLPLVGLSGWAQDTDFITLYPVDEWHKWLVNIVTVLVCLHILAVILMSFWMRKNLILAMLPGWRKKH